MRNTTHEAEKVPRAGTKIFCNNGNNYNYNYNNNNEAVCQNTSL